MRRASARVTFPDMDAASFLSGVGAGVKSAFGEQRSILSFAEYLDGFLQAPRLQARNAAQWLRDAILHFGTDELSTPVGALR